MCITRHNIPQSPDTVTSAELVIHMAFVRVINLTLARQHAFIPRSLIHRNKKFATHGRGEELRVQETSVPLLGERNTERIKGKINVKKRELLLGRASSAVDFDK